MKTAVEAAQADQTGAETRKVLGDLARHAEHGIERVEENPQYLLGLSEGLKSVADTDIQDLKARQVPAIMLVVYSSNPRLRMTASLSV